jgi:hypothetical protein
MSTLLKFHRSVMKSRLSLLSASCLGLSQLLSLSVVTIPMPASAEPMSASAEPLQIAQAAGSDRLRQMFSPEIQATINACSTQGKADLAAGAGADGSLKCGDGSSVPNVAYADYVDTVSNILAASVLVGMKTAIANEPRITPEVVVNFLSTSQGVETLRNGIETAITQNQLVPADSTQSVKLLTDAVIQQLTPILTPTTLDTLLGTPEQSGQIVSNFCTAPGTSVPQALTLVPGLTPIQLYAICIQESGITDEVLRMLR